MALLDKAKTLTAVALAATALATVPSVASASDYRCENKNDEAQVVGGVLGAVVGGIVGSEVAGRGDRNEGAVIGAILGAGAGAALGDESVKCRREVKNRVVHTTQYQHRDRGYQPAVVTVGHRGHNSRHRDYGYNNRGHNNRGYNRIDRINYRLDALRAERRDLERRNRYDNRRWVDRRIRAIGQEIRELKNRKRRIKNASYERGYDYRDNRRGHYHGNSRSLCYSNH